MQFCGQTLNTSVQNAQTVTRAVDTWGDLKTNYTQTSLSPYILSEGPTTLSVDADVFYYLTKVLFDTLQGTAVVLLQDDTGNKTNRFVGLSGVTANATELSIFTGGQFSIAAQAMADALLTTDDEMLSVGSFMNGLATSLSNRFASSLPYFKPYFVVPRSLRIIVSEPARIVYSSTGPPFPW